MQSIATLGIAVKTQGVKEAERDLKDLEQQGAKTERRASEIGKAWGKALGTAIAGGVGIAATAFGIYIKNTIEAERVQAQLTARIKSTGAAAGLAIGDLNKMAAALQNATTFDDESIGEAQALLLTFTKVTRENFERATKATLDMSIALGTDLKSSALQVGKALNDPVQGLTALSRAGVQFSESQKDTIKRLVETGHAVDAQKIILRELETQMGGAAAAARNTLGGALQALKNSFDNLLEGDSGDAGVKGAREAIESLNATMNDPGIKSGVQSIINGIASITNAALSAIPAIVEFNRKLEEAFGLTGSGGKRQANLTDFGGGFAGGINSLLHGRFRDAQRQADRAYAGFFGGQVADFTNVKGAVDGMLAQRAAALAAFNAEHPLVDHGGKGQFANVNGIGLLDTGTGKGDTGGSRGRSRELPDFSRNAAAELAKLAEQEDRASQSFLDMQAALSGPLAQEMREHQKNIAQLNEYAKESPTAFAGLNDALALEAKRHEDATRQIERQLDPIGTLLDQMRLEVELIGKSNGERAIANELVREGIDLSSAYAQAKFAEARAIEQAGTAQQRTIDLMDNFRRTAADSLSDLVLHFGDAKNIVKDFFDSLAEQITHAIAQHWIDQLFGQQGSNGADTSGGNWLGSIFGALLGGGKATGEPVSSGRIYEVGEAGPELYEANGRSYMIPPKNGNVVPLRVGESTRREAPVVNQTINVQGTVDPRTRAQLRQDAWREMRRANARNG